ncbi:MAG: histidine kinase [Solirubrobacterales bacterium]|nr:histidine kinase [Solirubrobacterales bacterium]
MTGLVAIASLGWVISAGLALVLARRRSAALAHGEHLARVAHELRGPLHAAGLVLYSARRHATGDECGRALAALEIELGRAALAAGDLAGDVPRGRMRTTTPAPDAVPVCDVGALALELSAGWEAMAQAHGRRVDVLVPGAPVWARGARLRLAQALGNLVANALEHGDGQVQVVVAPTSRGHVHVEVCDDGPGLPATVASLVARPADPARARGRGLGIASAIAADAGGRLSAAPAGRGARLVVQLAPPPVTARRRAGGGGAAERPSRPLAS